MALTTIKSDALPTIPGAKIANDAINNDRIADNSVDSDQYVDGSIDHEHLADDAVDGDIIADNAVGLAHMAGGTDGVIITYDASGNPVHVGPGTDGQVLTSTGAGSPPAFETLPTSGATLSGSTDNTVVTVTGSNAMAGEANLTFDGSQLVVTGTTSSDPLLVKGGTEANASIRLEGGASSDDNSRIASKYNLALVANDDANIADREVKVYNGTTTLAEFKAGGDVKINDGNLVIGTAGHGIDFSATSDSSGTMSNELLDDYEEGTWDPVLYSTGGGDDFGYSSRAGYYQKVGGVVHYYCNIQWTKGGGVSSGYVYCKGFPFTTRNNPGSYYYIGSNMELGDNGSDPFVIFMANGNNTIGPYNTGGATGLTGFCETGDIGSSGSSWFSLTVFTDA